MNSALSDMTGQTFWITGLSGAGKTTLANALTLRLRALGHQVVQLDGDTLRDIFSSNDPSQGHHDRDSRLLLAMRYGRLCQMLSSQGLTVVIATISMFNEVHCWNRENLPGYKEIYLKVPLHELRRRDPKGIYRSYDQGTLRSVAGLDLVVDEPLAPDWRMPDDTPLTVEETLNAVLSLVMPPRIHPKS